MNKSVDFSQPQRQSLPGIVVMFANTLQKSVRAFWPILLIWLVKFDSLDRVVFFGIVAGVVILIGIISYLQYHFFTFHIDNENQEFVIQKGIINKTRITIQLHKIQQVNINQSIIQRLVGVYKLEIDTAGSDKKEASISAISKELALELKNQLIHVNSQEIKIIIKENNDNFFLEESSIKIDFNSLLKIGFTANYVKSFALLLLVFSTLVENIKQVAEKDLVYEYGSNYLGAMTIAKSILFVVGIIFMLVLVINLVRTLIKYFNFSIVKDNNTLLLSHGLLETKSFILNPNKVQIVKATQNFFQQKLNVNVLQIKQASSDDSQQKAKDQMFIPGCSAIEKKAILKLIFGQLPSPEITLLPNFRKLILNLFSIIFLPIGIGFLVNYFANYFSTKQFVFIVLFYSLTLGVIISFGFKNYRLSVSKDFIIKQNGAWDIENTIIEPNKIQAITTQQFFWQKATNIGSVTLSTAGGNINFTTGNYSEIKTLVNYWLYQLETTNKNWM